VEEAAAPAPEEEDKRFRVVIVTSELAPYSKSGGLADVCSKLSVALSQMGHRVMTVETCFVCMICMCVCVCVCVCVCDIHVYMYIYRSRLAIATTRARSPQMFVARLICTALGQRCTTCTNFCPRTHQLTRILPWEWTRYLSRTRAALSVRECTGTQVCQCQ